MPFWKVPAGGWGGAVGFDALAKGLAVAADAADRDAAEVHAVVALFAADQRVLLAWPLARQ
jgi:hypothetical protein